MSSEVVREELFELTDAECAEVGGGQIIIPIFAQVGSGSGGGGAAAGPNNAAAGFSGGGFNNTSGTLGGGGSGLGNNAVLTGTIVTLPA